MERMPASISMSQPLRSRLDNLPNEILETLMGCCDGPVALYALLEAYPQANALFENRPHAILLDALRCSTLEVQLQKMLCAILSIRQHRRYHDADEAFQHYVHRCLQDQSVIVELDLSSMPSSDGITVLEVAVEVCNDVSKAERSFIETQMPIVPARIRRSMAKDRWQQDQRHQNFATSLNESCPSSTELHRIRRALWRLRLYFEAFYIPYSTSEVDTQSCPDVPIEVKLAKECGPWGSSFMLKQKYIETQRVFFTQMTVWELEELECAWYHLCHQARTFWCCRCPHCDRRQLPDDYVGHLRECEHDNIGDEEHNHGCNFKEACSTFRSSLEHPENRPRGWNTGKALAQWPDPLANKPSAGFKFLHAHNKSLNPKGNPRNPWRWGPRGAHKEFVIWGYCMWDRERLQSWHLIDDRDQEVVAVLDWWKSTPEEQPSNRQRRDFGL